MLDMERDAGIFGRLEIDIIVRWMWYFIKYYKTMEEVELSAFLLNYYMTEEDQSDHIGKLNEASRSKIVEFLCKSFFVHSDMLFESCFEGMTMEEVTTSINEAGHRATKRVAGGPRPNHGMGESAKQITKRNEQNETAKAKSAAYDATSMPGKAEDRKRYSRELTNFCNKKLFKEYKYSPFYVVCRLRLNAWLIKRNYNKHPTAVDNDLGKAFDCCQSLLDVMENQLDNAEYVVGKRSIRQLKEKTPWYEKRQPSGVYVHFQQSSEIHGPTI